MSDQLGRSRRIVIVGAGLGGTATAIRLLQFAREPAEIVLIERRADYRNAGPAYDRDSNHWHHVFTIQAGRMSAFREDVDDFVNWANCRRAATPVHVFALLADMDYYVRQLAADGFVMCTAELRQLALSKLSALSALFRVLAQRRVTDSHQDQNAAGQRRITRSGALYGDTDQ